MKLSEAILLGSTLKPQTYGALADDFGTCALGAALDAIGKLDNALDPLHYQPRVHNFWPWSVAFESRCPICGGGTVTANLIAHLNDEHMWTRERIAAFVASEESTVCGSIEYEESRQTERSSTSVTCTPA